MSHPQLIKGWTWHTKTTLYLLLRFAKHLKTQKMGKEIEVGNGKGNWKLGNGNWKLEMVVKHGNDSQFNGSCLHTVRALGRHRPDYSYVYYHDTLAIFLSTPKYYGSHSQLEFIKLIEAV